VTKKVSPTYYELANEANKSLEVYHMKDNRTLNVHIMELTDPLFLSVNSSVSSISSRVNSGVGASRKWK